MASAIQINWAYPFFPSPCVLSFCSYYVTIDYIICKEKPKNRSRHFFDEELLPDADAEGIFLLMQLTLKKLENILYAPSGSYQKWTTSPQADGVSRLEFILFRPLGRSIILIYPDTLRYRDSFNLQILMRFAFTIWVLRIKALKEQEAMSDPKLPFPTNWNAGHRPHFFELF